MEDSSGDYKQFLTILKWLFWSIIVEMSGQTTFGDKKSLRLYIKFERLAES